MKATLSGFINKLVSEQVNRVLRHFMSIGSAAYANREGRIMCHERYPQSLPNLPEVALFNRGGYFVELCIR